MPWNIDFSHSQLQFVARHMMIAKVTGYFESFSGEVNLDLNNPERTTADIRIDTASVNTRDERRDAHLQSADFFDVERYPVMRFQSKRVEVIDEENARLIGDLTIKDITHEVVLDVQFLGKAKSPWGASSAGFSASTTINRKDWGLNWNVALETGGFLVGDKIGINIDLELVEQPETATEAVA